jgi:SAM-dependent methyltransferase
MSYYDAWAETYDIWSADMTEDVPFYVDLAREAAEPIVELAVGTGRVAIPIARETGKRVIGIDVSAAMLEIARERAVGLPVELHRGDMRELAIDEPVELVICPFRALLHLPTWSEKRRVFDRVAATLEPGGRFAFNTFVFNHHIAAKLDGTEQDVPTRHRVRHAPGDNRIDVERGDGAAFSLWWATKSEWDGLVDAAGLETEALYGWFDRRPFDDESPEFVWVARKP